jgi:hypothetical protein
MNEVIEEEELQAKSEFSRKSNKNIKEEENYHSEHKQSIK